ncbi:MULTISPECIES: ABC transporter ATP-binding protein [unclassified Rhizobium]|uniref:ABC transporter ATP-binding protein n=1 Tax=unclassified Rhizobium TaxID=2613769 RepID=UPI001ADC015B|nr:MULTISPECIES: ABC transporter ATP-binding protein [unclassified Rhizobium]MBO9096918.1 ABC transporter ATP-binding protein [Rhizobium sp. L58/93]MBO9134241.1 ABC transporter ATP-binding protein [Rhizobium sp. B209b/85]MBO9167157.1 ABC transporter ATP-binding protein [Rhizobium sp. L245/93]MBO9183115.1 ABC transporter ATP-binding protein [Rhizobium sp. E27B/91]QXZ83470.1 ABC transporter ATP-binding protein [Rhizobium sp. K1/93]
MSIAAENLIWSIGRKTILDGISFSARSGKMLGLLGPNGSGKTSLLRLLAGLKKPDTGQVTLGGQDIGTVSRRNIAQRVAFVEQHATTNAGLRVIDVVKLGRFPHRSMFSGWSIADEEAVEAALARTGMGEKRQDRWHSLSGGERQRTQIARALAQSPKELILDEPTNHLDIQHQIGLLRLVSSLPMTSIIALHDLNHAAMFCDELIVLERGKVVASGTPEEVLTETLLRDVFSVDARVELSSHTQRPHIHYLG